MADIINQGAGKNWWAWVIVAIIAVLIVFYFSFSSRTPTDKTIPDKTTQALEQVGTSDEVSAIEQDLGATDLSGLDKELSDIEAELGE